jgi:phage portal protein BeeE
MDYDFFEYVSSFLVLTGNAYIRKYKSTPTSKSFDKLFVLKPDALTIENDVF